MRSETKDSSTAATGSPEAGLRARIEDAIAREAAAVRPAATTEPISPELALIDPQMASLARAQPPISDTDPSPPQTVPAIREAPMPPVPQSPASSSDAQQTKPSLPASSPPEDDGYAVPAPRRRDRRFGWLALGLALGVAAIAAGALFLPTSRLLRTAHLHSAGRRVDATIAAKRPAQSPSARRQTASDRTAPPTAQTRLAPLRAQTFGWVRVPEASYYRVRFFRGGREVFEALPTRARIVLPAHWRFRGRRFALAPGRYRWVVQAGFGVPSSKRYGKTVVATNWIAAPR